MPAPCGTRCLGRGGPDESGFVRFAYRPFDNRWLYWEKDTKLLDEKRADYRPHVFEGNLWMGSSKREIQAGFSHGAMVRDLANWKYGFWGIHLFPAWLREEGLGASYWHGAPCQPFGDGATLSRTVSVSVSRTCSITCWPPCTTRRIEKANAGALRMGWPRILLPGWPDGEAEGAAQALARSAAHGRWVAGLLDSEQPVSSGAGTPLRPARSPCRDTVAGRYMAGEDFAVTAGWGHFGAGDAVMPGRGRIVERAYRPEERGAFAEHVSALGETTFDVYLNGEAYWRNVPAAVWDYRLGGYQVLKKWLSYREHKVLGRETAYRGDSALHRHCTAHWGAATVRGCRQW